MLDIKAIRENPEYFKKALKRKFVDPEKIDTLLELDKRWRELKQALEHLRAEQNKASKVLPTLEAKEKEALLARLKELTAEKKEKEKMLESIEAERMKLLLSLPNPPLESAPDGKDDTENVVIATWGEKPSFDFTPKEHWEIAEAQDLLDLERSAKVSGSRFYFMKNELAILQRALIFWAFQEVHQKFGFTPMIPPFMTRAEAIKGTGFFDKDENYCVNPGKDDLYLIGTSEVPVTSYYAKEILPEAMLPQKFVSYSPCFRREAGSYGKDTKGIFRVHQFEKVEMVIFCLPEQSEEMHELLRSIEEHLMQQLGLHYQVVNVCTGDLGNSAAKKYDIEAWLPGQQAYREMTSTSICTDFQARRLNIRVKRKDGSKTYLHTLNGTAVSSRPLIAIMEQLQEKDGTIRIPKVLQPLCGFEAIKPKKP